MHLSKEMVRLNDDHFMATALRKAIMHRSKWVTLKPEVPHSCSYWCTPKKIKTRTNYRKRIKQQDSRLKREEITVNQCTETTNFDE